MWVYHESIDTVILVVISLRGQSKPTYHWDAPPCENGDLMGI